MAAASASSLKMLATAPKAPTHVPSQIIKLVELAEDLKSRLSKYKQVGITTKLCGLCGNFQTLNKRLEDVKAEIIQRTSKKGGKRSRKNKKSHKKRTKHAHKKRTKRARHTRKH